MSTVTQAQIDEAKAQYKQIKPLIGMTFVVSNAEAARGLQVTIVKDGQPASKAGILKGDVIQSVNNVKTTSRSHFFDGLLGVKPGMTMKVEVLRDGESKSLTLLMGGRSDNGTYTDEEVAGIRSLAMSGEVRYTAEQVEDAKRELASMRPLIGMSFVPSQTDPGLQVTGLTDGLPADTAGLEKNDLITKVNGVPTSTQKDFFSAIQGKASGDTIPFEIVRNGSETLTRNLVVGAANRTPEEVQRVRQIAAATPAPATPVADDASKREQMIAEAQQRLKTFKPLIGMAFVPSMEGQEDKKGLFVTSSNEGQPAHTSGLRNGDLIKTVNGKVTHTQNSFFSAIHGVKSGDTIPITATRSGESKSFNLVVGARDVPLEEVSRVHRIAHGNFNTPAQAAAEPAAAADASAEPAADTAGVEPAAASKDGEASQESQEAREALKSMRPLIGMGFLPTEDEANPGLKITGCTSNQPAARAGLQVDDVIKKVNAQDTHTQSQFFAAIRGVSAGDELPVEVDRKGETKNMTIVVGASDYPMEEVLKLRAIANGEEDKKAGGEAPASRSAPQPQEAGVSSGGPQDEEDEEEEEEEAAAEEEAITKDRILQARENVENMQPEIGMTFVPSRRFRGLNITNTKAGHPADVAGLQKNDILHIVGSVNVTNKKDFFEGIKGAKPGDSIPVRLDRGDEAKDLNLILGARGYTIEQVLREREIAAMDEESLEEPAAEEPVAQEKALAVVAAPAAEEVGVSSGAPVADEEDEEDAEEEAEPAQEEPAQGEPAQEEPAQEEPAQEEPAPAVDEKEVVNIEEAKAEERVAAVNTFLDSVEDAETAPAGVTDYIAVADDRRNAEAKRLAEAAQKEAEAAAEQRDAESAVRKAEKQAVEEAEARRAANLAASEPTDEQKKARAELAACKVTLGASFHTGGANEAAPGIPVTAVAKGKAAELGGIRADDEVMRVNGVTTDVLDDYFGAMKGVEAGSTVPFVVRRGNEEIELPVVMGAREKSFEELAALRKIAYPEEEEEEEEQVQAAPAAEEVGVSSGAPVADEEEEEEEDVAQEKDEDVEARRNPVEEYADMRKQLGMSFADVGGIGLVVQSVVPDGPCEQAGLRPDDHMTEVNHMPVNSTSDFMASIKDVLPGQVVPVVVKREGEATTRVPVTVGAKNYTVPQAVKARELGYADREKDARAKVAQLSAAPEQHKPYWTEQELDQLLSDANLPGPVFPEEEKQAEPAAVVAVPVQEKAAAQAGPADEDEEDEEAKVQEEEEKVAEEEEKVAEPDASVATRSMNVELAKAKTGAWKPFIGMALKASDGQFAVTRIQQGSPADVGGIEVGDIITHVDGVSAPHQDAVMKALQATTPGDDLDVTVLREGQEAHVALAPVTKLYNKQQVNDIKALANDEEGEHKEALDCLHHEVADKTRATLQGVGKVFLGLALAEEDNGVSVNGTKSNGPAHASGLEKGDKILKFGGKIPNGAQDVLDAIRQQVPGSSLPVVVNRNGEEKNIELVFGAKNMKLDEVKATYELSVGDRDPKHHARRLKLLAQKDSARAMPRRHNRKRSNMYDLMQQLSPALDFKVDATSRVTQVGPMAEGAGLQEGDEIIKFKGKDFRPDTIDKACQNRTVLPGDLVPVVYRRGETQSECKVQVVDTRGTDAGKLLKLRSIVSKDPRQQLRDMTRQFGFSFQVQKDDEETKANEEGLEVVALAPGAAAESAGLQMQDRITEVNDHKMVEMQDFFGAVAGVLPGDVLRLAVVRDGEEASVDLTVGAKDHTLEEVKAVHAEAQNVQPKAEDRLKDIKPVFGLGFKSMTKSGMVLIKIVPEGPADRAALAVGDVLKSINGKKVQRSADFFTAVRDTLAGETLSFEVSRARKTIQCDLVVGGAGYTAEQLADLHIEMKSEQ